MSPLSLRILPFAVALSVAAADRPVRQRTAPAAGIAIPAADRQRLELGTARLATEIESLRARATSNAVVRDLLPDVEIFHKAVDWALRYDEFFRSNEIAQADILLRLGSARAQQLASGHPAWLTSTGLVVRGYRSKIDGSVQPYGLVVPSTFASNTNRARRLDVWLHGRDDKLTELKFISDRLRSYGEFTPPDTLVLHPYGRFCNAFKFAGETDVFEAIAHVQRSYPIDTNRLAIRGFSMGGAGTWHLAAHHPETWAAAAPGAGFAETAEYTGALSKNPPWYEQRLWHLYDATDYALNLSTVPTIAYSGEIDKQKQAADIMARAMKIEGMELEHVIGPGVAHKYEPGAKKELARRFDELMAKGRDPWPKHVRFETWTLRFHQASWLEVRRLASHWERASVDALWLDDQNLNITTTNILDFSIDLTHAPVPPEAQVRAQVDGSLIELPPRHPSKPSDWRLELHRVGDAWKRMGEGAIVPKPKPEPAKSPGLQGPIDDAFMGNFTIVRPTKPAMYPALGTWLDAELARFTNEWRAQFRGDAPVIDSADGEALTAAIASSNLILWGDPASNPIIAKMLPKLPLKWDPQFVRFGAHSYPASTHIPTIIFPNPLNPEHYVVLNSGPTFLDFGAASNAQQTPKLPDFALIDSTVPRTDRLTRGVALAGFFDESWQWPAAVRVRPDR